MGKKIKKRKDLIKVTGDIDDLSTEQKLDFAKKEFEIAKQAKPNYKVLTEEIQQYIPQLPKDPTLVNLKKINKIYAETQSYLSRVTTIEVLAIDNHARWKRLTSLLEDYIEERTAEILVSDEVQDLTNLKAEAKVRVLLKKEYNALRKMSGKLAKAESFTRMIASKKKDLVSVLTTLGKQVKALSLEQSVNRY